MLALRPRGRVISSPSYSSSLFWAFFKVFVSFLQRRKPQIEFAPSNKGLTQPRSEPLGLAVLVHRHPHLLGSPHVSSGRPEERCESSFKGQGPQVQSHRNGLEDRAGNEDRGWASRRPRRKRVNGLMPRCSQEGAEPPRPGLHLRGSKSGEPLTKANGTAEPTRLQLAFFLP